MQKFCHGSTAGTQAGKVIYVSLFGITGSSENEKRDKHNNMRMNECR
jgi:hypothetical protein